MIGSDFVIIVDKIFLSAGTSKIIQVTGDTFGGIHVYFCRCFFLW